jgi:hypothetical protein
LHFVEGGVQAVDPHCVGLRGQAHRIQFLATIGQ